jgi:hypothetical protein
VIRDNNAYFCADISTSLPSQTVSQAFSQPVTHTLVKDSIYTLTVEIPSILPSSLFIDTSALPSSFEFTSSSSSSYATRTYLPVLAIIAAPAVMLLPQINAWGGIWEGFVGLFQ